MPCVCVCVCVRERERERERGCGIVEEVARHAATIPNIYACMYLIAIQ